MLLHLPTELLAEIVKYTNRNTLTHLKCTCKSLRDSLDNATLVNFGIFLSSTTIKFNSVYLESALEMCNNIHRDIENGHAVMMVESLNDLLKGKLTKDEFKELVSDFSNKNLVMAISRFSFSDDCEDEKLSFHTDLIQKFKHERLILFDLCPQIIHRLFLCADRDMFSQETWNNVCNHSYAKSGLILRNGKPAFIVTHVS